MKKFAGFVIRYRIPIIITTILITLFLGYFIKDLKINADIISYLPKSDPVVKLFNYIGEEYGGNLLAMVAVETDGIFNKETIERINDLTSQFKLVDGISYVTSLTNVLDIKKGADGGIEIGRLIDEYNLPKTTGELQKLKDYTLSKDVYRGRLVSDDAKATLIICRLREEADKIKTARQLKEIVNNAGPKEKIYYGGLPFQMMDLSEIILNDLKYLIPLVSILIVISLFLGFRTLRGVILPLSSVFISAVWTLGIMSLLRIPLTAISDIIPVILLAVGSAYGIHVVHKFNEEPTGEGRAKQSEKALTEVGVPVILAGITTIAGFLSFIFGSYLSLIREFGLFSALGVLFALIISLTFIPSILSLLPAKGKTILSNGNIEKKSGFAGFMDKVGEWILKNEKPIIMGGIIVVAISILGIPRIQRKVDMLDYFKPGSSIRLTEELMQNKFGGSIPIQILVKGDIQDPMVLKEMKKMEDFLESQGDAHNSQSVAGLIEEMNDVMGEGKVIPDSKDKVANLWFLLEGEEVMSQLVNPDKTEAVIQATIINLDTKQIRKLVESIDNYIKNTNTDFFTFTQTGMPSIYQHLDDSVMRSQVQSLIISIILVFICLVFMLRSFTGGLIGLVPIGFTLLFVFGFMGFTGIPLDIATILVGSIAIGIGIDYSIHFVSRFSDEFKKSKTELEALDKTLETTGKAILINVITVMMGFLVLILANLIPLQRFGILVAITMIGSGLGAITLLPATILLTKASFIGDFGRLFDNVRNHLSGSDGK